MIQKDEKKDETVEGIGMAGIIPQLLVSSGGDSAAGAAVTAVDSDPLSYRNLSGLAPRATIDIELPNGQKYYGTKRGKFIYVVKGESDTDDLSLELQPIKFHVCIDEMSLDNISRAWDIIKKILISNSTDACKAILQAHAPMGILEQPEEEGKAITIYTANSGPVLWNSLLTEIENGLRVARISRHQHPKYDCPVKKSSYISWRYDYFNDHTFNKNVVSGRLAYILSRKHPYFPVPRSRGLLMPYYCLTGALLDVSAPRVVEPLREVIEAFRRQQSMLDSIRTNILRRRDATVLPLDIHWTEKEKNIFVHPEFQRLVSMLQSPGCFDCFCSCLKSRLPTP